MGLLDYIILVMATAAGLAAAMGGVVLTLPEPRFKAARIAFWFSAFCFGGLGVIWSMVASNQTMAVKLAASGITAALSAMALTYVLSLIGGHEEKTKQSASPDVTLSFAFPDSPTLMLRNQSEVVARNIKWVVLLWNLDNAAVYSQAASSETADKHEPLQIPIGNFDFLKANSTGGPLNLFESPLVKPHVKKGDRLFGSAAVSCPDCERGHTFVVSIIFGQGGWYAEVPEETSGNAFIPRRLTKPVVLSYVQELTAKAPEKNRVAIADAF